MSIRQLLVLTLSIAWYAQVPKGMGADGPGVPGFGSVPYGSPYRESPPYAMVLRGNLTWLGDFDKDGNFIRDPIFSANFGAHGGSFLPRIVRCLPAQHFVYEHRSGRLIKGTMVSGGEVGSPYGYLVPEIGSMVLDLKDVDLKNPDPDRHVWNLPELKPLYEAARKKKYGDRPVPNAPDPPVASVPDGQEFIPFSKLDTANLGMKVNPNTTALHEQRRSLFLARDSGGSVASLVVSDDLGCMR